MRKFLVLVLAIASFGCAPSYSPSANPEPIDVTGTVTLAGQPVADATLNLMVLESGKGLPATIAVVKGEFKAKITPGKYSYFLTQGKNPALFKNVPEKYTTNSADRKLEISTSSPNVIVTFE